MLTLVGAGLSNWKDISLLGIEILKSSDKVYLDLYTNVWSGKSELENLIDKPVAELSREDMEQNSYKIMEEAEAKDIAILVPGDPMAATTHISLVDEARKRGINTRIVHNASIFSAVCETGLHAYKFGAAATVPFQEKTAGAMPVSVYDTMKENHERGLHTLLLMDIDGKKRMGADEAMEILLRMEAEKKCGIFTNSTKIVVFSRAGYEDSRIKYGQAEDLKAADLGEPPMVIIVPGKLHFTEEEYLITFQ